MSAITIASAWTRYKQRKTFESMKNLLFLAESGLTIDMLRRLCPKELELVKDPFLRGRIRLRFGGTSFPPKLFFKIYTKGINVHYFNGRQLIVPGSQAARDSWNMMGTRQFTQQIILNQRVLEKMPVIDPVDVTSKQEYTQYMSMLDNIPINIGGRNNGWRELDLSEFPPHRLFYDLTSIKRSLVRKTIESLFKESSKNTKKSESLDVKSEKPRLSAHSQSSIKKIRLRKMQAIFGYGKSGEVKEGEAAEAVEEDIDDFDSLFEWATDLNEEVAISPLDDYKHGIDFLY